MKVILFFFFSSVLYATEPQAIHTASYASVQAITAYYPLFGLDASAIDVSEDSTATSLLIGDVLPHPSPMAWSKGNGTINYRLSQDAAITLRVFDMRARQIFVDHIDKGQIGGQAGYNRYPFTQDSTDLTLSAGVYILYMLSDGELLAKQKLGVIP